jgi:hypothetical protein
VPIWPLFLVGLIAAASRWRTQWGLLLLAAGWFAVPLAALVVGDAVLYDNFRQILFILPPVFLLAGIALDRIRSPQLAIVLSGLCVLPGVLGIVRLFPYEYAYYNSFVGGTAPRFERYWGTDRRLRND